MGTIRERSQTRPFESAADEAVVTLVATADRVRDAVSRVVGEHGITLQQYNVLRILRGAGAAGLPTLDIAGRMIDKSPGITRLVERLEARRLVRRVRCPRTAARCCATRPPGRQLLAGLESMADGRRCSPRSATRVATLVGMLDEIRRAAAARAAANLATASPKETEK
jgi:DNA-binding MarR family transcriptional regulator